MTRKKQLSITLLAAYSLTAAATPTETLAPTTTRTTLILAATAGTAYVAGGPLTLAVGVTAGVAYGFYAWWNTPSPAQASVASALSADDQAILAAQGVAASFDNLADLERFLSNPGPGLALRLFHDGTQVIFINPDSRASARFLELLAGQIQIPGLEATFKKALQQIHLTPQSSNTTR